MNGAPEVDGIYNFDRKVFVRFVACECRRVRPIRYSAPSISVYRVRGLAVERPNMNSYDFGVGSESIFQPDFNSVANPPLPSYTAIRVFPFASHRT